MKTKTRDTRIAERWVAGSKERLLQLNAAGFLCDLYQKANEEQRDTLFQSVLGFAVGKDVPISQVVTGMLLKDECSCVHELIYAEVPGFKEAMREEVQAAHAENN